MRILPPKIDPRKANDLFRIVREMAPHYTKEWPAKDADDPGVALLKIFAFIAEGVISRLNRAPDRNFLAFLDMLGIRLVPARASRAPVRFLFANGTEVPFLVPSGTQVSAPPTEKHPVDLPFETLQNLLVVPSALAAMFAVDPAKDSIYRSPPGFLELQLVATDLPPLIVTAFSAANSKFLQLDPPDQVKAGDFLRIDEKLSLLTGPEQCVPVLNQAALLVSEHLVAAEVKGPIVTVTEPLAQDHVEGTLVQKVTKFELFEGKNWQEHALYLGHSDYFAIKSEAQVLLDVEHAPGASSNLQAFNVSWQFFGVTETDKEEGWHDFQVDVDGSQGFSSDGRIVLIKPAGEIKETEISGSKSRWIRAKLNDPLPATPPPVLPRIESITLGVASGLEDLSADKAFSNDTPLTTDVQFFPFGTEPRIFDRFSFASEEAFSKPGAEIELKVTMDTSDLLAAPGAVVIGEAIRVFARAAAGKLLEFKIDTNPPPDPVSEKHDPPPDTRISAESLPAVVGFENASGVRVGAFVKAEDGKIYLRSINNPNAGPDTKDWIPLQSPTGDLQFDPAAVLVGGNWLVFVVAGNQLFSKVINPLSPNVATGWTQLSSPFQVASTPYPIAFGAGFAVGVTDANGHTQVFDGTSWNDRTPQVSVVNQSPRPGFLAAQNARPFLQQYSAVTDQIRIFTRSTADSLIVFDTEDITNGTNLGKPSATVGVASNPSAIEKGVEQIVYVRGSDNRLWEIEQLLGTWTPHSNPTDFSLAGDPFGVTFQTGPGNIRTLASVFSTTDKNSLLEFRVPGEDLDSGTLRAGPLQIVMLDAEPGPGTHFIHITDGPAQNSSNDAVRRIDPLLSDGIFAVLDSELDELATEDTEYELFTEDSNGSIQSVNSTASETVIELEAAAAPQETQFLFAAGELRAITSVSGDEATFQPPWTTPNTGDQYFLLDPDVQGLMVSQSAADRAVLAATASNVQDEYKNFFFEITSGTGASPVGKLIKRYFAVTQNVVLNADFSVLPTQGSGYKVAMSSVAESLLVYVDPDQRDLRPELSWEYWNGRGFSALQLAEETTENFLVTGSVKFTVPEDIGKTEVGGQENYWIRARIVGGDYGREEFIFDQNTGQITVKKDPIRPPLIKKFSIKYTLTNLRPPQFCLTFNNLNYLDQTAANVTPDKHFNPFIPLSDAGLALYLGFEREFKGGPVKIYFAADELEVDETSKPKLLWEFAFENDWKELLAEDATDAFTKPDFVTLNVPDGFQNSQEFGQALYWLRATLVDGIWSRSPLFSGVFLNTVEAMQARTVLDEILGSSVGIKNQKFQFQQVPVIEGEFPIIKGEEVRIREALTEEERDQLVLQQGQDAVLAIRDQQDRVLETWIRWTEVLEFFDSDSNSRHYRLDRATGEIEFGDGVRGRIPPAGGDNINAFSYQAGGGKAGNVDPGEINTPVTAVAGVDSVINPVAAGGGSDAATNEDMLEIGPAQISHRERAVTPADFEELALEASREVRKARCLPNRNASGRHESGWTTVHIVPDSTDATPKPSLELRRAVQRYLADRADVTLVDQKHIFVGPPDYIPISVEVTVYATSLDEVATAEQKVKRLLEQFLHPLTGGPNGEGWEFGRDLATSDLYSLLEDIDEVDHVGPLRLSAGNQSTEEQIAVAPDAMIAGGDHKITMSVANGE